MNDRQRTILGLVAVFSLVGIAVLSLTLISSTTPGGLDGGLGIIASEEQRQSAQSVSSSATDDISIYLRDGSTIVVEALAPLPNPTMNLILSGVESPSVENRTVDFKESAGNFNATISLGAMAKGQSKDIVLKYTLHDDGRVEALVGADGFASTQAIAGKLP